MCVWVLQIIFRGGAIGVSGVRIDVSKRENKANLKRKIQKSTFKNKSDTVSFAHARHRCTLQKHNFES